MIINTTATSITKRQAESIVQDQVSSIHQALNDNFETKSDANSKLNEAKAYTDMLESKIPTTQIWNATVSSNGWQFNSTIGYFVNTVEVVGIRSTDYPVIDVLLSTTDDDSNIQFLKSWRRVTNIITDYDYITLFADTYPSSSFSIQLMVVK